MHKITNMRSRRVAVSLPGKGIILHKRGDFDFILDSEVREDTVQALLRIKAISIEKTGKADPPKGSNPSVEQARERVEIRSKVEERAKRRARGEAIRPDKPSKPRKPAKKPVTEKIKQPEPAEDKSQERSNPSETVEKPSEPKKSDAAPKPKRRRRSRS